MFAKDLAYSFKAPIFMFVLPPVPVPQAVISVPAKPAKDILVIRKNAEQASPPIEQSDFRASDMVELIQLDPSIQLDIRYATANNFLGIPVYSQPRAFLQRPVAQAVVRAQRALKAQGYGLLVYDAYRPWYLSKVFWDATPPDQHKFLADPAKGSNHNRGCAVDLTLLDIKTKQPVVMPSDYDEFTERAYPSYSGGADEARRLRDLLNNAMSAEGFTVHPAEWWHFDHASCQSYRIENVRFEEMGKG